MASEKTALFTAIVILVLAFAASTFYSSNHDSGEAITGEAVAKVMTFTGDVGEQITWSANLRSYNPCMGIKSHCSEGSIKESMAECTLMVTPNKGVYAVVLNEIERCDHQKSSEITYKKLRVGKNGPDWVTVNSPGEGMISREYHLNPSIGSYSKCVYSTPQEDGTILCSDQFGVTSVFTPGGKSDDECGCPAAERKRTELQPGDRR